MLISYSMPGITSASVTGADWLTADGAAALYDGKPARRARLQWGAGSSLDAYVQIALGFGTATPLRVLALLGTTLPAGVRVDFLGAGGDGLGGTCDNTRTVTMPDGTTAAWAVARENEPAETGCWIRIHNDCNGAPWAVNDTIVDLGEAWAGPAVDVPLEPGWELGSLVSMSSRLRTRGGGLCSVSGSSYSVMRFVTQSAGVAQVRWGALSNGMDWMGLRAAMTGDTRVVVIPRFNTALEISKTALYGVASDIGTITHIGGDFYRWEWGFEEIPSR